MNADEFSSKVAPASKRSRVAPYWDDVIKLKNSGYALNQLCEFLNENGVQISIAGLWKYIRRWEGKKKKGGNPATASRAETDTINRPMAEPSTRTTGSVKTAPLVDSTSSNPLNVLSGSRELGEFNPIPTAKIEFDE